MKFLLKATLLLLISISTNQVNAKSIKLCSGKWIGELKINNYDVLPFDISVQKKAGNYIFSVENGAEVIQLTSPEIKNDSVHIKFPYFNSELIFAVNNRKEISGYWYNYNKGNNYKIPFNAFKSKEDRFNELEEIAKSEQLISLEKRWKVTFEPNTKFAYPAVGLFEQTNNVVTGTFLTETGDYRFLAGNINNDSLFLSCFDGSHAFLFKAGINDGQLKGKFYSGNHWSSEWEAQPNNSFELTNPDELTYVVDNSELQFTLKDLNGNDYSFPNSNVEGKVIIIQIMGTWCPNCLDETQYYKELYSKYKEDGLEIISVCYEAGDDFETYVNNVNRLKAKLNLEFNFLIGGKASKNLASEHFSALNEVISFPTTIFIGRDGQIKRIHTGFNGPGTGSYYEEYVTKTNALIESLLMN